MGSGRIDASAGLTAWVEFGLLRHALQGMIGSVPSLAKHILKLSTAATIAALVILVWKQWLPLERHPALAGIAVMAAYGLYVFAGGAPDGSRKPGKTAEITQPLDRRISSITSP